MPAGPPVRGHPDPGCRGRERHGVAGTRGPGVPPGPPLERGGDGAEAGHRMAAAGVAQEQVRDGTEGEAGGGRDVQRAAGHRDTVPTAPRTAVPRIGGHAPARPLRRRRPADRHLRQQPGPAPPLHAGDRVRPGPAPARPGHVRQHGSRRRRRPGCQSDRRRRADLRHRLSRCRGGGRRRLRGQSCADAARPRGRRARGGGHRGRLPVGARSLCGAAACLPRPGRRRRRARGPGQHRGYRHGRALPAARGRPPRRDRLRRPAARGRARAAAGRGGRPRGGGGGAAEGPGGGGVGGGAAGVTKRLVVVGIGADGWDGLSPAARRAIESADVLRGSARQLALVPAEVSAERMPWPSPMGPELAALARAHPGRRVVVLASGDPMLSGVGTSLVRLHGPGVVEVVPHPSSVSLACARVGWAVEETTVVSVVGRPVELLVPHVTPGRRLLVLGSGTFTPAEVAKLLAGEGYGASRLTALAQLGGPDEQRFTGTAAGWPHAETDPLVVTAVEVVADPGTVPLPAVPGLPDDAYAHDGQLTKRDVRAVTLARLAPLPGQLLWDVGAGAGSIGIEWMRVHPSCRAVAVESHPERARRIAQNAARLGVPGLRGGEGRAPEVLEGLPLPDAVFVGGGATTPLLLDTCWDALRAGGRLVVNAVTVQSEAVLAEWFGRVGGELVRLGVQRAEPVGSFTGWKAAMPVTIWSVTRP